MARPRKKTPAAEEELRTQLFRHNHTTVEDDVRGLYRWATRRRFKTVADSLSRILGKLDRPKSFLPNFSSGGATHPDGSGPTNSGIVADMAVWEAGDRRMHPAFWELFKLKLRRK